MPAFSRLTESAISLGFPVGVEGLFFSGPGIIFIDIPEGLIGQSSLLIRTRTFKIELPDTLNKFGYNA